MKRKALPKMRKLIHRHQRWACWEDGRNYVRKFLPLKAHNAVRALRNGAAKRSCVMERQRKARELFNAVLEAAERYRNERKAIRSEWFVYDDRNGDLIGIVWAASEDEAHEAAMIDVAESGRDREMDYCGFYVEERR